MESKHTPARWYRDATFPWEIWSSDRKGCGICTVHADFGNEYTETDSANARLIAAAPELLEACSRLLSEITTDDARRYHCARYGEAHWLESVNMARTAIARATT